MLRTAYYTDYSADGKVIDNRNNTKLSGLEQLVELVAEDDINNITLDKWIELFSKAKEIRTQRNRALSDLKVTRAPHTIPYTDIEVSMGAPWISAVIIDEFVKELLNITVNWTLIEYEPVSGAWHVNDKMRFGHLISCTVKYGTPRYNALYIIEATLNLREIKLFDNGNSYAEQDTIAALEKQQLIISEFRSWICKDEDRIWEVEEAYNKMFSGLEVKQYKSIRDLFPKMSPDFQLYDYQKNAVEHIINEKNTLLAFDVGAGKTYIMITAAMEMRRIGISKKNMLLSRTISLVRGKRYSPISIQKRSYQNSNNDCKQYQSDIKGVLFSVIGKWHSFIVFRLTVLFRSNHFMFRIRHCHLKIFNGST